ncbi:MAG TPA: ribosome maturation factor RimM [Dehalococcoidia bacterium]
MAEGFVAVGRVVRPWGVTGDLKVQPLTDFPEERFAPGAEVWLRGRRYAVDGARLHRGYVYLRLTGVHSANDAEALRDALVEVPEAALRPLPPGEYYRFQILGLAVYSTEGEYLGQVRDVLTTGSNDVYVVRDDGPELLVPAIDDVVKDVDLAAGRMTVELLEGMR